MSDIFIFCVNKVENILLVFSVLSFSLNLPLVVGLKPGNTKGGSITVPLTSCLTGLDQSVLQVNKNCQLSYSWFQNNETGDQWYSDTSPFSYSLGKTIN